MLGPWWESIGSLAKVSVSWEFFWFSLVFDWVRVVEWGSLCYY